jgi:hypothetical protein
MLMGTAHAEKGEGLFCTTFGFDAFLTLFGIGISHYLVLMLGMTISVSKSGRSFGDACIVCLGITSLPV